MSQILSNWQSCPLGLLYLNTILMAHNKFKYWNVGYTWRKLIWIRYDREGSCGELLWKCQIFSRFSLSFPLLTYRGTCATWFDRQYSIHETGLAIQCCFKLCGCINDSWFWPIIRGGESFLKKNVQMKKKLDTFCRYQLYNHSWWAQKTRLVLPVTIRPDSLSSKGLIRSDQ